MRERAGNFRTIKPAGRRSVLIAIFVGWFMLPKSVEDEVRLGSQSVMVVWKFMIRVISPIAVLIVLYNGLF